MYDLERFYGTKVSFYKGTDSYKSYKLVQTPNFSLRLMPYLWFENTYSRVPIRRHGTFIRHTPFIRPNTFSKKWAVPFNWISMSKWSTFRYKFVSINLHLLNRPRHMWRIFRPIHFSSCVPLRLFRTPLLIGTREYVRDSLPISQTPH